MDPSYNIKTDNFDYMPFSTTLKVSDVFLK